jgi:hypothetical protein
VVRAKDTIRRRLRYRDMAREDQVLFRQHLYYLNTIVTGWSFASPEGQAAFRDQAIPPSTFASEIRAARTRALAAKGQSALTQNHGFQLVLL